MSLRRELTDGVRRKRCKKNRGESEIFEVNIRQNREPETRETGLQSTGKVGAKRSVLGMLLGSPVKTFITLLGKCV